MWIQLHFTRIPKYVCNPEHVNEREHMINTVIIKNVVYT